MKLLLIRHADAGDRDPERWPDDSQRPLTARGEKRQAKVAKRLARHGLVPALLLSSPWRRAWQTAEITAKELDCPAPVATEALASPPSLARIGAAVGSRDDEELVALVGHDPWISELAARLLTGQPNGLNIDFPKSGVMGLDVGQIKPGAAILEFFWRTKD